MFLVSINLTLLYVDTSPIEGLQSEFSYLLIVIEAISTLYHWIEIEGNVNYLLIVIANHIFIYIYIVPYIDIVRVIYILLHHL